MRLFLPLSLALLAGCSQPPVSVDLNKTPAVPSAPMAAPAAPAGQPGAQGIPGPSDIAARCRAANWRATGYRHGLSGYPLATLNSVSGQCADAGVTVDRLAYSTGRLEGLELFCSMESGYRRAKAGQSMDNPCPPALAKRFEAGYARGMATR